MLHARHCLARTTFRRASRIAWAWQSQALPIQAVRLCLSVQCRLSLCSFAARGLLQAPCGNAALFTLQPPPLRQRAATWHYSPGKCYGLERCDLISSVTKRPSPFRRASPKGRPPHPPPYRVSLSFPYVGVAWAMECNDPRLSSDRSRSRSRSSRGRDTVRRGLGRPGAQGAISFSLELFARNNKESPCLPTMSWRRRMWCLLSSFASLDQ